MKAWLEEEVSPLGLERWVNGDRNGNLCLQQVTVVFTKLQQEIGKKIILI